MIDPLEQSQNQICQRFGVLPDYVQPDQKVGISLNVRDGIMPLNGLRHPPEGDTTGWYIWAGMDFPEDPNFFKPLHVRHLYSWCQIAQKYLALPPGWRFLVTDKYEDVWRDESLLDI